MKVDGTPYRSIWIDEQDRWSVRIIDQTRLPWAFEILRLTTLRRGGARDPLHAGARRAADRRDRRVRPLPRAARRLVHRRDGACGRDALGDTRPTAVNLRWALERMLTRLRNTRPPSAPPPPTTKRAPIADEDVADLPRDRPPRLPS